jgi:histidinol-phosphate aminotransferase
VPLNDDLSFPTEAVLAAMTSATRLVFLANPNNPTGLLIPREAIDRILAAAPSSAVVFMDEAYFDFSRATILPQHASRANLVIGRTFAKAHGLAGLRVGALICSADTIGPLRAAIPPYSVNTFAVAGLRAALRDRDYVRRYVAESDESKRLLYEMCAARGLTCWRSHTNFVLIRVGHRASEVVAALAAKGIFVRDRGHLPLCAGCIRVTAGLVSHTRRCIAAFEEVLCAVG